MKSYPIQPEFIFVVVVFILILFVSNYGSSTRFVPYVSTNSKLPQYPYEGFSNMNPEAIDPVIATNPMFDTPRTELLHGYALNEPDVSKDPIGNLPSNHDCIGKASNLSNSTGGICFDQNTLGLIKTRGGNQTA